MSRSPLRRDRLVGAVIAAILAGAASSAWSQRVEPLRDGEGRAPFGFAVFGSATASDRGTVPILRAIDDGPARFVVHFELAETGRASCTDAASARRRTLLDAATKPVVPVVAGVEWADCSGLQGDPSERLEGIDDTYFGGDESLGQVRLPWLRQSAVARFKRYRENLRWQVGRVVFATINLPDNNNNFRFGAGRNGEFEERLVANRAWLERTFRTALERRAVGIALFVDGAPRFTTPLHAPDNRVRERDGYYEFKLALRELVASFRGQVLLVQGHRGRGAASVVDSAHPLHDAGGKPLENLTRLFVPHGPDEGEWLRIDVDADEAAVFRTRVERVFDDPSGELYGERHAR